MIVTYYEDECMRVTVNSFKRGFIVKKEYLEENIVVKEFKGLLLEAEECCEKMIIDLTFEN